MLITEAFVSSDLPTPSDRTGDESGETAPPEKVDIHADPLTFDYEEVIKFPLWIKQVVERVAQKYNQEEKRKNKRHSKVPLGYFVTKQIQDWAATIYEEEGLGE